MRKAKNMKSCMNWVYPKLRAYEVCSLGLWIDAESWVSTPNAAGKIERGVGAGRDIASDEASEML